MIYCRGCGHQLHESASFCPHCGYNIQQIAPVKKSVWMAITALVLSIFTLLILLSVVSDMDTLNALSNLESLFGGNTLKQKLAEDAADSAIVGLLFALPALVLGIISLVQDRGGRGMAIASVVINGINFLIILALFGFSIE